MPKRRQRQYPAHTQQLHTEKHELDLNCLGRVVRHVGWRCGIRGVEEDLGESGTGARGEERLLYNVPEHKRSTTARDDKCDEQVDAIE